ncbi:MAG: ABC transmembrane type-1 domain-containing protein [Xylanivirga thermophila]|jgi:multiple sugar transport system permease protein|uniref:carbohydrate ABC transporter permease n=1 Tax=Xylanivirga thermophila TaxID=2496273 RepID=UPI0039F58BA1
MKFKKIIKKVVLYFIAIFIAVLVLMPFFWMISTSLKSRGAMMSIPIEWIPKEITLDSYKKILSIPNFLTSILNSFYLATTTTVVQIISASMAAFAFSKIKFKGREVLFKVYIATMMIPFQVIFIPLFIIMSSMKLTNNLSALLLLQFFNAFAIFMLRQQMMGISDDFIDAATIDGASQLRIFISIIIPLARGTIATLAVMAFMGSWNDYLFPLVMLSDRSKFTLPLILNSLSGQYSSQYNLLMAGSLISMIPIIILYMFMQKYFKAGLQVGGIKG